MRDGIRTLSVASAAVLALVACSEGGDVASVDTDTNNPFVVSGVTNFQGIAQLTGPGSTINDTEAVAVAGTDLGSMVNMEVEVDGETEMRTYFVFGDTFGVRDEDAFGGGGGNWRSNALAYTTDDDPTDGITFDGWITDDIGLAKAPIEGEHDPNNGKGEVTKIPTHGLVAEGTLYLYFMSVNFWGDPGEWDANYSGIARSTDLGQTWETLESPRWPGDSNFIQMAAVRVSEDGEDYFYLWAIPAGRFGGVKLMRTPATTAGVEDLSSYRYFAGTTDDGSPIWSEEISDAETVLEGETGEHSVMYSEQLDRWIMTYTTDENAVLSEGITPWGPWSEPHVITTQSERPGLYSPYINPRYVSEDGLTLYFSMSLWGPYNVFWNSVELETTS